MGRITIFTREDCHYCLRAKRELQYRCLPFVEIPLEAFPERRADMMAMSGRLTVPQIFMNDTWLGGSEELLALLEQWDTSIVEEGEPNNHTLLKSTSGEGTKSTTTISSNRISEDILKNSRIWRMYQRQVASQPDPTDPRLALPSPLLVANSTTGQQQRAPSVLFDRDDVDDETGAEMNFGCIPLPDGTCAGIGEVTNDLVEQMPRMKLAYLTKFYTDCFPGDKGVDALLEIYPFQGPEDDAVTARTKAVGFGRLLQRYGILHHVCNQHSFHDTGNYYYRLQPFHQPHVLNSFQSLQRALEHLPCDHSLPSNFSEVSPDSTAVDDEVSASSAEDKKEYATLTTPAMPPTLTPSGALKLLTKLQKWLSSIESRATGRDGVDFLAAKNYDDTDFQLLEEGSCQLQCMDGITLAMTMSDAEKMVFGIHLYNIMIRHAYIKVGIPVKSSQRGSFFTGICYNVANQILSLDDVEHGILRANTRHPYHLKPQFVGDDPRRAWAVSKLDPRIHFTLFCGANSCPPINSYTVDNLEAELSLAAQAFCQEDSNVLVDEETNTVHLSMLFKWYRNDFGCSSCKELPAVFLSYLPKGDEKYSKLSRMIQRRSESSSGSLFRNSVGSSGSQGKDIKVKFLHYDWSSKAAPGKCLEFHSGLLKTKETSLRAPFSKAPAAFTGGGCVPAV